MEDSEFVDSDAFPFELKFITDIAEPIPILSNGASINLSFRHFNEQILAITPSTTYSYNLGYRLFNEQRNKLIAEHRAFRSEVHIPPQVWTQVTFDIESDIVEPDTPYVFIVDFVKENQFWFAKKVGSEGLLSDTVYNIRFRKNDPSAQLHTRVESLANEVRAIRRELELTSREFGANISTLGASWAEIKTFQSQIPQILNAISAANAASRIVGDVRVALDAETGALAKSLSEFRRELAAVWDALDAVAMGPDRKHR